MFFVTSRVIIPVLIVVLADLSPLCANETSTLVPPEQSTKIEFLWETGNKSEAEKMLDEWKDAEKNSPWPWVQAASMSFRKKKYKRSLGEAKTALDKSPQCPQAYYWRGRSYEALNKLLDAANEYRAAILVEQEYKDAKEALDRVLTQLGS